MYIIPTLGPKVYEYSLRWAIRSHRDKFVMLVVVVEFVVVLVGGFATHIVSGLGWRFSV